MRSWEYFLRNRSARQLQRPPMKLLGLGGRKANAATSSGKGVKRWQHYRSDPEETEQVGRSDTKDKTFSSKARKSRSTERRNDVPASRSKTTSPSRPVKTTEKSGRSASLRNGRAKSQDIAESHGQGTSKMRSDNRPKRNRSRGGEEDPNHNSSVGVTNKNQQRSVGRTERSRLAQELPAEIEVERQNNEFTSDYYHPSNQRSALQTVPKKTNQPVESRTVPKPIVPMSNKTEGSRGSNESAFAEWASPGRPVEKDNIRKNIHEPSVDTTADTPKNAQSTVGSSYLGVRSSTLPSPNGGGIQRLDAPTTQTDRLADLCMICEAITAAPFHCIQVMFSVDDINGTKKSANRNPSRTSRPPRVIKAINNKEQTSISVFTRGTFGTAGAYSFCGDDTTRDECSTPDTSDASTPEQSSLKVEPGRENVASEYVVDPLEKKLREQLLSSGKLDKELLKKILTEVDETKPRYKVESVETSRLVSVGLPPESPAVSETSYDSGGTTESSVAVVRGKPQIEGRNDSIQPQVNAQDTIMTPPFMRPFDTTNRHSIFGIPIEHALRSENLQESMPQYRSKPPSPFRIQMSTRETDGLQPRGHRMDYASSPHHTLDYFRPVPSGNSITGPQNGEYGPNDQTSFLPPTSYAYGNSREPDGSPPPGNRWAVGAPPIPLPPMESSDTCSIRTSIPPPMPLLPMVESSDTCSIRTSIPASVATPTLPKNNQETTALKQNRYGTTPTSVWTERKPQEAAVGELHRITEVSTDTMPSPNSHEYFDRISPGIPVMNLMARQNDISVTPSQHSPVERSSPVSQRTQISSRREHGMMDSRLKAGDMSIATSVSKRTESSGPSTSIAHSTARAAIPLEMQMVAAITQPRPMGTDGSSTLSSRRRHNNDSVSISRRAKGYERMDEWDELEAQFHNILNLRIIENCTSTTDTDDDFEDLACDRLAMSSRRYLL